MAAMDRLVETVASAVGRTLDAESLDAVCRDAAAALGVDALAVTLASQLGTRAVVGASDEAARTLEDVQITIGDGPCTEATRTAALVRSRDLLSAEETRWPEVVRQLVEHHVGIRAVTASPMFVGSTAVGSVNMHSRRPAGLAGVDLEQVETVVRLLTVAVLALRARDPGEAEGPSVFREIPQATGMVIAALGLSPGDALDRLRGLAFLQGRLLVDVARDVVAGRQPSDLSAPDHEGDGAAAVAS